VPFPEQVTLHRESLFVRAPLSKARRALRAALGISHRTDYVYAVLLEFSQRYGGPLSILEFGAPDGDAFASLAAATHQTSLSDRVLVHAFRNRAGRGSAARTRYPNLRIHYGLFADTLNEATLATLRSDLPILVCFDAADYSSTRLPFERLLPYLPDGCVICLDEAPRRSKRNQGEARLVSEVNHGMFGTDLELVLDVRLSHDARRVYRFVRGKG